MGHRSDKGIVGSLFASVALVHSLSSMTLLEQITFDMKEAMKAKDEAKLSTLRMLKSALKNKQIDLMHELSDEEVLSVIKTQMKQLKDSLESFSGAGREDLAVPTQKELVVLEAYMPAQMSEEELEAVVKAAVEESGVTSKEDMGKAMGVAMKKVAGRADGSRVKEMVGKLLAVLVLVCSIGLLAAHPALAAESEGSVFAVSALRIARIFLLLFGIVSINMILIGGFNYMIASGRDATHSSSIAKITTGILGTIIVAALFTIATIALENLN